MTSMETETIAAEITRRQIGRSALFMIGAKDFVSANGGRTLVFRVGRNSKSVNLVKVTLDTSDTYTLGFYFTRGVTSKCRAEVSGVYADQLRTVIEAHTGLLTSL